MYSYEIGIRQYPKGGKTGKSVESWQYHLKETYIKFNPLIVLFSKAEVGQLSYLPLTVDRGILTQLIGVEMKLTINS